MSVRKIKEHQGGVWLGGREWRIKKESSAFEETNIARKRLFNLDVVISTYYDNYNT